MHPRSQHLVDVDDGVGWVFRVVLEKMRREKSRIVLALGEAGVGDAAGVVGAARRCRRTVRTSVSQNVGDEAGVAGVGVALVLSREKTPLLRHALAYAGADAVTC